MKVHIKIIDENSDLPLPSYATCQSAGLDLLASNDSDINLEPGKISLIPTGIAIALPNGFEAQIRSRSGLSLKHGICVLNAPGTIDSDYRGEIGVIMINLGNESFTIKKGMKIAQMVISKFVQIEWEKTDSLDETERSDGGFGSTGIYTNK